MLSLDTSNLIEEIKILELYLFSKYLKQFSGLTSSLFCL